MSDIAGGYEDLPPVLYMVADLGDFPPDVFAFTVEASGALLPPEDLLPIFLLPYSCMTDSS